MLAEQLGMTVSELLAKISSYEISEWKAYYRIKDKELQKSRQRGGRRLGG